METAQNVFNGGMILDSNIASATNSTLTNALNATLGTFNGNEQILQNDMGNVRIPYKDEKNDNTLYAELSEGFIPIGTKVFGNVMYIVSCKRKYAGIDEETGETLYTYIGEIGSFPSPDYSDLEKRFEENKNLNSYEPLVGKLVYKYAPLYVGKFKDEDDKNVEEKPCGLTTELFNFDLEHPVELIAESTYDNSVNLIFTDNKNLPRLINTGFAVHENDEYEIIDRYGKNNTNRYSLDNEIAFNLETSLYNDTSNISKFVFNGLENSGKLKVGNYALYAISSDKDGNDSDIICESGMIPVFIGTNGDPFSVNGGQENMATDKAISVRIENLDSNCQYVNIYFTRCTSANNETSATLAYKVLTPYPTKTGNNGTYCDILLTGYEDIADVHVSDINLQYFNADTVKSQTITQNILFQGNVKEKSQSQIEHEMLQKISLTITPKLNLDKSVNMDSSYKYTDEKQKNSYYNANFAYESTGYHIGEIYRFGIVYIRKDNSLTPVYNTLGVTNLTKDFRKPTNEWKKFGPFDETEPYLTSSGDPTEEYSDFNIKGVCRISEDIDDLMQVIGIEFEIRDDIKKELENNYKGFFFVRQKRIPTLLSQGYATNVCETSFLPSINVGYSKDAENINDVYYTDEDGNLIKNDKLYLYESFTSGAFKYRASDEDYDINQDNFYPKRIAKTTKTAYQLKNNYRSNIFTLSDYSYAYLDKIISQCPVAQLMNECGVPSITKCVGNPTIDSFTTETVDLKRSNKNITVTKETEYLALYYSVRENRKNPFDHTLYVNDTKDSHDMWSWMVFLEREDNSSMTDSDFIENGIYRTECEDRAAIKMQLTYSVHEVNIDSSSFDDNLYIKYKSIYGSIEGNTFTPINNDQFSTQEILSVDGTKYIKPNKYITGETYYKLKSSIEDGESESNINSGDASKYNEIRTMFRGLCHVEGQKEGWSTYKERGIYSAALGVSSISTAIASGMLMASLITSFANPIGISIALASFVVLLAQVIRKRRKDLNVEKEYKDWLGVTDVTNSRPGKQKHETTERAIGNAIAALTCPDLTSSDKDDVDETVGSGYYWSTKVDDTDKYEFSFDSDNNITGYYEKDKKDMAKNVYLFIDEQPYIIRRVFGGRGESLKASVNNLYKEIVDYIDEYNKTIEVKEVESRILQDPTIPTFNGKYQYTDKVTETDNYKQGLMPVEQGAYAMFSPEYELNTPYYNNIFTGQNVTIKPITEPKYLSHLPNFNDRLFKYENTKLTNKGILKGNALGVEEGISLASIQHGNVWNSSTDSKDWKSNFELYDYNGKKLENLEEEHYKSFPFWPRQHVVYFSTRAGLGTSEQIKFAGYPFLAHVGPTKTYSAFGEDLQNLKYGKLGAKYPYNLLRGEYGKYIGLTAYFENENGMHPVNLADRLVNIYIPGYSNDDISIANYFKLRFQDQSSYYAISDRISLDDNETSLACYRGDCFIGWYTHRVNRNFNDDSAPYNDTIINGSSFAECFDKCFDEELRQFDLTKDPDAALKLNKGDLNAVQLGSWVTFPVRSSFNICIRSTDDSWTDEKHLSGNSRSFYPLHSIDVSGSYKLKESDGYNEGFSKSGSEKVYRLEDNNIFVDTYYKNRVMYSNILVNNAFQNGNRVFMANHYRDYTDQYGAITKLLELSGNLIIICEHGILLVPVNERALAAEGSGGMIYVNTSNVLPENPKVISDTYGTTWQDSVIQTPYGIFGVDSYAKKIWYTNGQQIQLISDFRIQSFLNEALEYYNKQPNLGTVNIKTHYNAFKNDVMFTAYYYPENNSNENVLWNICWNINQASSGNGWQTFYSWIPSYSGNIGNNFISLNHQTDRAILGLPNSATNIDDDGGTRNYLWKHGQTDFVPVEEYIKPTFWYGSQHPFEFEFVVNKEPINHKIFNDLRIISNKAEPESFHYEVIGECYDFNHEQILGVQGPLYNDKSNIFYRQELTKAFYHFCENSQIRFNKKFLNIKPIEISKSTFFPLYYSRNGQTNIIYDSYQALTSDGYEYQNLAGAEIVYDRLLNEFKICNHVKGVNLKSDGRLRGNMHYKEDGWHVQIPSINYLQKNEYIDEPFNGKLSLNLENSPIPEDAVIIDNKVDLDDLNQALGLNYNTDDISFIKWKEGRKEMRIKDKYLRVKIRYSGQDVALITGVLTLYTNSYS